MFKSIFATVINANKNHHFLLFHTDLLLITVDFYIDNRLVIRIGDKTFVFDTNKSDKRISS